MTEIDQLITKFADLILESKNIVALTGAGMSTESGIPDFRSPGTGLWTKVDPDEFASIHSYVSSTSKNLKFMLEMGTTIFRAKPHKGHKALTRLQKMGKLKGVLTQNIDGLHSKARTKNVIELHGTANESICLRCKRVYPITTLINQVLRGKNSPICEECGGLLKPNAIFFGEPLESAVLRKADEMIANIDLMIVLGSSLLVYPVAFYPHKAIAVGAKLAIINIQPTEMDHQAEVVIHDKIGDVLPQIVDRVEACLKK
ncbi:MAG: SIR2 family NAD-dependent protein deacylase [Promethearchaeota archaeon]